MKHPSSPPSTEQQAQQEARAWLRLLQSGEATAWDAQGFQKWMQNTQHQQAFQQAKHEWESLNQSAQTWSQKHTQQALYASIAQTRRRRTVLQAGIAGASLSLGMGLVFPPAELWPSPQQWGADARTRTGEQRQLAWQDATLNLNTRTSIQKLDQQAGFKLLQGEAAVQVHTKLDFEVHAGVARCRTRQAHFELSYLHGHTRLVCLEGEMQIHHPYGDRRLTARQSLHYQEAYISNVESQTRTTPAAWREGELSFENTPLEQVITEINRYRQGRIVLLNSNIAQEPLSGRFQLHALDQALSQIQHTFGLHSRNMPAGLTILS